MHPHNDGIVASSEATIAWIWTGVLGEELLGKKGNWQCDKSICHGR